MCIVLKNVYLCHTTFNLKSEIKVKSYFSFSIVTSFNRAVLYFGTVETLLLIIFSTTCLCQIKCLCCRWLCDPAERWYERPSSCFLQPALSNVVLHRPRVWNSARKQFRSQCNLCHRRRNVPLHCTSRHGELDDDTGAVVTKTQHWGGAVASLCIRKSAPLHFLQ